MHASRLVHGAVLAALLLGTVPVSAQESSVPAVASSSSSSVAVQPLTQAVISGPEDIAVGRTIVLDASLSRVPDDNPRYQWFVEGRAQPISDTVEAVYTPEVPGVLTFRLVVRTTGTDGVEVSVESTHVVTVYTRKIVLIADAAMPADKLELHRQTAEEAGVFLRILQPQEAPASLGGDEVLTQMLVERGSALAGASAIVIWTDGITGLQSLTTALQNDIELLAGLQNQSIVLITDRSLQTLARVARGPYSQLTPRMILVTHTEAINPLLTAPDTEAFIGDMEQREIEYLRIDASTVGLRPWNVLSSLVNAMLTQGIPSQTVILLLVLPVIVMILAFLKQVIGITTFGLYTPAVIALSFLSLGWQLGLLFLLFIILVGNGARVLMRRWRLLYIPKVAIILTAVSFGLLILMGICAAFEITFTRETIFAVLILSTLSESFLSMKSGQGISAAALGIGETVLAALICVFIVQWDVFQSFVLAYPELTLLALIVDVILGRWTGLRLVEYFRFHEVFKHLQEE